MPYRMALSAVDEAAAQRRGGGRRSGLHRSPRQLLLGKHGSTRDTRLSRRGGAADVTTRRWRSGRPFISGKGQPEQRVSRRVGDRVDPADPADLVAFGHRRRARRRVDGPQGGRQCADPRGRDLRGARRQPLPRSLPSPLPRRLHTTLRLRYSAPTRPATGLPWPAIGVGNQGFPGYAAIPGL